MKTEILYDIVAEQAEIMVGNCHIKIEFDPSWQVNVPIRVTHCDVVNDSKDKVLYTNPDWQKYQEAYCEQEMANNEPYGRIT